MAHQNTKALTDKWAQITSRKYKWLQTYEKPCNLTTKKMQIKSKTSLFSAIVNSKDAQQI